MQSNIIQKSCCKIFQLDLQSNVCVKEVEEVEEVEEARKV